MNGIPDNVTGILLARKPARKIALPASSSNASNPLIRRRREGLEEADRYSANATTSPPDYAEDQDA